MNDGKTDSFGQIWCGTMDMAEEEDCGSLYRFGPGHKWERMDSGYRVPNGPAFSPDGNWLYYSDMARRAVYRFARNSDGSPGKRGIFISFSLRRRLSRRHDHGCRGLFIDRALGRRTRQPF